MSALRRSDRRARRPGRAGAREFARVFLVYGRTRPIALLAHGHRPGCRPVGAGRCCRPRRRALPTTPCGRSGPRSTRSTPAARPPSRSIGRRPSADELTDRAVATGDGARHQADRGVPAAGRGERPMPLLRHAAARARNCSASLIPMAKAGRAAAAEEGAGPQAAESSRAAGVRLPTGPGSRPDAAGPRRGRHRGGRAGGLRRQPGRRTALAWIRSRSSGRRAGPGGQPGHGRVPAHGGDERLARGWQPAELARHVGRGCPRSRGDGRRHDRGRDARLPGSDGGPPLVRSGGGDRAPRPGTGAWWGATRTTSGPGTRRP